MAKPRKSEKPHSETYPDAWDRFERAVDVVAKAPPQHRTAKSKEASRKGGAVRRKRGPVKGSA